MLQVARPKTAALCRHSMFKTASSLSTSLRAPALATTQAAPQSSAYLTVRPSVRYMPTQRRLRLRNATPRDRNRNNPAWHNLALLPPATR